MCERKIAALFLCLLFFIAVMTGCWDKIEIEDRLFVLGMGFDKVPEEKKQNESDKIDVYFVSPIAAEATKGGSGPAYKTYDAMGESFAEVIRNLLTRFNKKQYFGHCKVIVLGEDIIKDGELFKQVLDFLGRSHELHKSMYVFASPGKVNEVFKVEPIFDRTLAPYIAGIADNGAYVAAIPKRTLAEILSSTAASGGNTIIPLLLPSKDSVEIDRMSIIKGYKQIAVTDQETARSVNRLTGKSKGGTVNFNLKGMGGTFRYYTFSRKISLDKFEGGKIYVTYKMETEGDVEGYMIDKDLLDDKLLRELEKQVEEELKKSSEATAKRFQQEYKVDLIGVNEYLQKHQPKVYKQIEKDYETYFSDKIVISVVADVKIRRVGTLK